MASPAHSPIPPLRLLFGEGFAPPGLPCSFAFTPFYGRGASNGPAALAVMPSDGWLDGCWIPESILSYQQSCLHNWTEPPSTLADDQSADDQFGGGQLSLSWYTGIAAPTPSAPSNRARIAKSCWVLSARVIRLAWRRWLSSKGH